MPKDETNWIPDNYYNGFLRGCLGNELLEDTPSKTALENAGCQISALCYLITPDQKQHNPRFMKPNELPTSIRKLFETLPAEFDSDDAPINTKAESEDVIPVVTDFERISNILADATSKICDECNQFKPIEAFAKTRGRGVRRQDVCIECQTKAKETMPQFKPDVQPQHIPIEEQIKDVESDEAKPMAVVSLNYLKQLAKDAFERGREYERQNICTVEYSLDELLKIGA